MIDIRGVTGDCIEIDVSSEIFKNVLSGRRREIHGYTDNTRHYTNARRVKFRWGEFTEERALKSVCVQIERHMHTVMEIRIDLGW